MGFPLRSFKGAMGFYNEGLEAKGFPTRPADNVAPQGKGLRRTLSRDAGVASREKGLGLRLKLEILPVFLPPTWHEARRARPIVV